MPWENYDSSQTGEVQGSSEVKKEIVFGKRDLYIQSHRTQIARWRMACGKYSILLLRSKINMHTFKMFIHQKTA